MADLFETVIVVGATAHAIEILRNDKMISVGQRKPIDWLVAIIARVCSNGQTDLRPYRRTKLCHVFDISNNNIRTGNKVRHSGAACMLHGRQDHRFRFAPN
jgi:hypothetical protein